MISGAGEGWQVAPGGPSVLVNLGIGAPSQLDVPCIPASPAEVVFWPSEGSISKAYVYLEDGTKYGRRLNAAPTDTGIYIRWIGGNRLQVGGLRKRRSFRVTFLKLGCVECFDLGPDEIINIDLAVPPISEFARARIKAEQVAAELRKSGSVRGGASVRTWICGQWKYVKEYGNIFNEEYLTPDQWTFRWDPQREHRLFVSGGDPSGYPIPGL